MPKIINIERGLTVIEKIKIVQFFVPQGSFSIFFVPGMCEIDFVAEKIEMNVPVPAMPSLTLNSVFGWIIVQQRVDMVFDWQLHWSSYVAGFGAIDSNFWLGLENLYRLTSANSYQLRVEVCDAVAGSWYSAEYSSFTVSDGADLYRLNVAGYVGDAGDALNAQHYTGSVNNNMQFSTEDNDNDNDPDQNCADRKDGGWWFNDCSVSCLMCGLTNIYSS